MSHIEPMDIGAHYAGIAGVALHFVEERIKGNKPEMPKGLAMGAVQFFEKVRQGMQEEVRLEGLVHYMLASDSLERNRDLSNEEMQTALTQIADSLDALFNYSGPIDLELARDFFDGLDKLSDINKYAQMHGNKQSDYTYVD
ncbi:hypothetical protein KY346_01425 [Candidatus Woesearchaeota archaeon]|nr:hypothetical protein [Candidatus Woesearchaeota archaeon]